MEFSIVLKTLFLFYSLSNAVDGTPRKDNGLNTELISNGSTYVFRSFQDGYVITVLPNGDVIADEWNDRPEQKWVVMEHPLDPLSLEFKQLVVPYNMLSGYEDLPENPGTYPRRLQLNKNRIMNRLKNYKGEEELPPVPWQIIIGNAGRYCIQNNGIGKELDRDDCEWQYAPWQYWDLTLVE